MDAALVKKIQSLPPAQKAHALELLRKRKRLEKLDDARKTFMNYTRHMWPGFIEGAHHRRMADAFDRVISGDLKRLIINMPPRHTKSETASFLLPSKYLGHYPDRKIMQLSHTADLATDFGRRVRDLVGSREYQEVFPGTALKADTKAAGRWNTDKGGVYVAMGIGGKIAGKGADLLIIDDAHSEQEYIRSLAGDTAAFDDAFEWYQAGPRQRLQPGAAIVIVMTRWHTRDLTGRLIKRMTSSPRSDKWEIIEFPALLPPDDTPLWPEFWSLEELLATKEELTPHQWNAQYQQNPTAAGSALVKKDWWKRWEHREPPHCDFVIQSWDTAYTAKNSSDYSACTDWGVFYMDDDNGKERPNLILLDAYQARLEFPDLKREALDRWKRRQPDAFIVEAKAAGLPLIFELRQMGIPVQEYTPSRGSRAAPNDKVARVNSIADLFASGVVWAPDTRWAEEVIDQFAEFPVGAHDDLVDSSTQALMRFRQGGFIPLPTDEDEDYDFSMRRPANYY